MTRGKFAGRIKYVHKYDRRSRDNKITYERVEEMGQAIVIAHVQVRERYAVERTRKHRKVEGENES